MEWRPEDAVTSLEMRLYEIVTPVVRSEGLILVELSYRGEQSGQVLRLYIDRPSGGVTLDECTSISRQVGDLLDVEGLPEEPYNLEVSSPGLTRRLKWADELQLFAGRQAKVSVKGEGDGVKTFQGRLMGVMGSDLHLHTGGKVKAWPIADVVKAKLEI